MPKIRELPDTLRPFSFHGIAIESRGDQAVGDCPFCGKDGKLWVSVETGQWDCKVCGRSGNPLTFIRNLYEASDKATSDYSDLAEDRGLLYPETLMHWGACRSILTGDWLIPGYDAEGKLIQLYAYRMSSMTGKMTLFPTSKLGGHGIHGVNLFDPQRRHLYLCEGPWDAMALWETMRIAKRADENELVITASETASILADANVLAVPGCGSVGSPFEKVLDLFKDRVVHLLFDSDHERYNQKAKQVMPPAGWSAMKRASHLLAHAPEPPEQIHAINWGEKGFDPELKSGYDVRDHLLQGSTPSDRIQTLDTLLGRIEPIPDSWVAGRTKRASKTGKPEIELAHCQDYETLQNAWRRYFDWTPGLDRALITMLAAVVSTKAIGDQLWIRVIGPPSCGKSTLCDALNTNKKYVKMVSVLTGFHSGHKETNSEKEDNSLISQLYDKTLIIKDGDTLRTASNKDVILAEARDIYDRTSSAFYRNKVNRNYTGLCITFILCGTDSLHELDTSELGERCVTCVVMDSIDPRFEDDVALRVAYRAARNMSFETDGKLESQHDENLVRAMQLTGGYVAYLRENAQRLLDKIEKPHASLLKCAKLGIFTAHMRARPSKKQDEKRSREMGARLASQFTRLAVCAAAVVNSTSLSSERVMEVVRGNALDTSRGMMLDIAHRLYKNGAAGVSVGSLASQLGTTDEKQLSTLRFLQSIGAAEYYTTSAKQMRWRLTERLKGLYRSAVDVQQVS